MTLDDLECQNRGFMDFSAILGCETHFKSELCRNQLKQTSLKDPKLPKKEVFIDFCELRLQRTLRE